MVCREGAAPEQTVPFSAKGTVGAGRRKGTTSWSVVAFGGDRPTMKFMPTVFVFYPT
jgi:hypothetical protein